MILFLSCTMEAGAIVELFIWFYRGVGIAKLFLKNLGRLRSLVSRSPHEWGPCASLFQILCDTSPKQNESLHLDHV